MRHACHIVLPAALLLSFAGPALCQTGPGSPPPPMVFAVPRLELLGDSKDFFDGIDLGFAVPISSKFSVTGNYIWDFDGEDLINATYNCDFPLKERTHGRASVGFMQDKFGLGLSAHRTKGKYGVGAFARAIEGEFQGGVFLSTPLRWGVALGRRRAGRSSSWGDMSGDVADMGAIATAGLTIREGRKAELATGTAWYPRYTANWRRMGQDAQSAGATVSEFGVPARPAWSFEAKGAMRAGPVVVGDRVFAGGDAGTIYALRLSDGSPLWTAALGSEVTRALTAAGGRIYAGTRAGHLVCLRPPMLPEGMVAVEEWRFNAGAPISSCPAVTARGLVVFGAADGTCYALDRNGKLVWSFDTRGPVVAAVSISSGPVLVPAGKGSTKRAMAVIYCAATDGVLYALRETDGKPVWTFATGSPLRAGATVADNKVLAGNDEGVLYAMDAASGQMLWRQTLGSPIQASVTVSGARAYAACADGAVIALSLADGKVLWTSEVFGSVSAQPILTRSGHLFVASEAGMLYALRCGDGRVIWAKNVREAITTAPAVASRYLLFGSETGKVHAFAPGGKWQLDAPPAMVKAAPRSGREGKGVEVITPAGREVSPASATRATSSAPSVRPTPSRINPPAGQEDFPRPGVGMYTPGDGGSEPGMTMLTRANDSRQPPIQLADSSSVIISGQVPAGIEAITVNEVPVRIERGAFRTRVDFYGTGAYPLTIEFANAAGETTADRRIVIVSSEKRPAASAPVFVSPEDPNGADKVAFTVAVENVEDGLAVSVLEIRDGRGEVVRAWANVGDGAHTFEWDGRDQLGKTLPDGEYVAVYTMKDFNGRSRSLCQPVIIDTAGM